MSIHINLFFLDDITVNCPLMYFFLIILQYLERRFNSKSAKLTGTIIMIVQQVDEVITFNPFPNKPWLLRVCSTSLLKTLREKKKLLVTSNFFFSHIVFYPFVEISAIFIKLEIVVCKLFQFGPVKKNCRLGKG